jgi:hypothetical protein
LGLVIAAQDAITVGKAPAFLDYWPGKAMDDSWLYQE